MNKTILKLFTVLAISFIILIITSTNVNAREAGATTGKDQTIDLYENLLWYHYQTFNGTVTDYINQESPDTAIQIHGQDVQNQLNLLCTNNAISLNDSWLYVRGRTDIYRYYDSSKVTMNTTGLNIDANGIVSVDNAYVNGTLETSGGKLYVVDKNGMRTDVRSEGRLYFFKNDNGADLYIYYKDAFYKLNDSSILFVEADDSQRILGIDDNHDGYSKNVYIRLIGRRGVTQNQYSIEQRDGESRDGEQLLKRGSTGIKLIYFRGYLYAHNGKKYVKLNQRTNLFYHNDKQSDRIAYIIGRIEDPKWEPYQRTRELYLNPVQGALWNELGLLNHGLNEMVGISGTDTYPNGLYLSNAAKAYANYRDKVNKAEPQKAKIEEKDGKYVVGPVTYVSARFSQSEHTYGGKTYEPAIDEVWGAIKLVKVNDTEITESSLNDNLYFTDVYGNVLKDGDKYIFPIVGQTEKFYLIVKTEAFASVTHVKMEFDNIIYGASMIELLPTCKVIIRANLTGATLEPRIIYTEKGAEIVWDGEATGVSFTNKYYYWYQPLAYAIGYNKGDTKLDLEIGNEPKEEPVDLALRKFITKINGQEVSSREPNPDVTPLKNGDSTTAKYNHAKDTLRVEKGDLVTYTIRVYNEGRFTDAYAAEIKDYLPSGLEFVASDPTNQQYGWTESNGTVTTTYLSNTRLIKFDGDNLSYADVEIVCKVLDSAEVNVRLVNVAEISKYAYEHSTEGRKEISIDIDSRAGNFPDGYKNNPSYDGNGVDGNYVKGQEDDDDFEAVAIPSEITPTPTPTPTPTETPALEDIDIGGTVWLDAVEGKQQDRDNVLTVKDARLEGIKVTLYKKNANGGYDKVGETTTDKDGNYVFRGVASTDTFKVEFEYGGQVYTPVTAVSLNSADYDATKSAGVENAALRAELNNKFYEIVRGTAKNRNGENTISLKYTRDEDKHTSTVIRDEAFNNATKIIAETEDFVGAAGFAKYVNLGLYERQQVNLSLMMDVKNVEFVADGKTETYKYNQKDELTAMLVEEKKKELDLNRKYNQAVYESDHTFRLADNNLDGTVIVPEAKDSKVYATYKIKVKNASSNAAKVSELKVYYDDIFGIESSWFAKTAEGNDGSIAWNQGNVEYGHKTMTTSSAKDIELLPNEDLYVFIRFEVTNMVGGKEVYLYSEITGYTTEKGLIDTNSEPNNISIENLDAYVKTYEDDTDRAPGLEIPFAEIAREMSGFVWVDKATEIDNDGVKIGNGRKDGDEEKANGIVVQLIEKVTIDGKEYEYIWQETVTGTGKVSYMDKEGKKHEGAEAMDVDLPEGANYAFKGYLSGNYIIRFRYGEIIADNIVKYSGQDYKSTKYTEGFGENTSSAKDNKARRLEVINYSIEQSNDKAEILANVGVNASELAANTWMYADTIDEINIKLGSSDTGRKVNFGLVERPASKLVAVKEVTGIKITNKGIVYVDTVNGIVANVQKEGNSKYGIELDDELINGATLEITYRIKIRNEGEIDTLYNYFEGDELYGKNQHAVIKSAAKLVHDYPEKMGFDGAKSNGWSNKDIEVQKLNAKASSYITTHNTLAIKRTDGVLYAELAPGEETQEVTITLSKLMTSGANDDLSYDNKVEIITRTNGAGRKDSQSIAGNYIPTEEPNEPDTAKANVTIKDPTGQRRIYFALGITSVLMIAAGIVLIKKKVLTYK